LTAAAFNPRHDDRLRLLHSDDDAVIAQDTVKVLAANAEKVKRLGHDPEKHALSLDPMGGDRFSEKIMLHPRSKSAMSIQFQMIAI
jgi:hypothetical protein